MTNGSCRTRHEAAARKAVPMTSKPCKTLGLLSVGMFRNGQSECLAGIAIPGKFMASLQLVTNAPSTPCASAEEPVRLAPICSRCPIDGAPFPYLQDSLFTVSHCLFNARNAVIRKGGRVSRPPSVPHTA